MNMILMKIGFGLMTFAATTLWFLNRKLLRQKDRLVKDNRTLSDMTSNLLSYKTGADLNHMLKAEVEEHVSPVPCFKVYRRIDSKHKLCLLKIGYNPADPDDREYKRIFAEERAEILNEKP